MSLFEVYDFWQWICKDLYGADPTKEHIMCYLCFWVEYPKSANLGIPFNIRIFYGFMSLNLAILIPMIDSLSK